MHSGYTQLVGNNWSCYNDGYLYINNIKMESEDDNPSKSELA